MEQGPENTYWLRFHSPSKLNYLKVNLYEHDDWFFDWFSGEANMPLQIFVYIIEERSDHDYERDVKSTRYLLGDLVGFDLPPELVTLLLPAITNTILRPW